MMKFEAYQKNRLTFVKDLVNMTLTDMDKMTLDNFQKGLELDIHGIRITLDDQKYTNHREEALTQWITMNPLLVACY